MKSRHKLMLVAAASALLGATAAEVIHAQASAPPGFMVAEIKVNDPEGYKAYLAKVTPVTDAFGGRFIVRGGKLESIEGAEPAGRVAIIVPVDRGGVPAFSRDYMRYTWSPSTRTLSPVRISLMSS